MCVVFTALMLVLMLAVVVEVVLVFVLLDCLSHWCYLVSSVVVRDC